MAGAVIVEAGPGIGTSVARRFAAAGLPLGLIARTVGGAVAPGGPYDPDQIAGHYWRLHTQPRPAWEHDVLVAGG